MAIGAIQVYGVSRIISKCPVFLVSKLAPAGPNHLTAEEIFQSVCYSSRFTHRICDFSSRCFISKIVVVVTVRLSLREVLLSS